MVYSMNCEKNILKSLNILCDKSVLKKIK